MPLHRLTLPSIGSLAAFGTAAAIQLYLLQQRISLIYVDYAESCLVDDGADIAKHYRLVEIDSHYSPTTPSHFHVAVDSDRVIGYLALHLPDPSVASTYAKDIPIPIPHASAAYLKRMSVHPDYQSRGIASQPIHAMMDHARKHRISHIILATTEFQDTALAMYKKHAWRIIGKTLLGSGIDLVSFLRTPLNRQHLAHLLFSLSLSPVVSVGLLQKDHER